MSKNKLPSNEERLQFLEKDFYDLFDDVYDEEGNAAFPTQENYLKMKQISKQQVESRLEQMQEAQNKMQEKLDGIASVRSKKRSASPDSSSSDGSDESSASSVQSSTPTQRPNWPKIPNHSTEKARILCPCFKGSVTNPGGTCAIFTEENERGLKVNNVLFQSDQNFA